MFNNKKLIIFDLDGTLIDSVPDIAKSINLMLQKLNKPTFPVERIRGWVGNGAKMLVKRAILGKDDVSSDFETDLLNNALSIFFEEYEQNVCNKTILYENVKTTLEALQKKGYIMAIATNKPERFIAPILSHLDLSTLFNFTIGGDTLPNKKPHPEPLLYICRQLQIDTIQTVMVGDSKNDILSAQAAQMDSIGVTYGYNYGQSIDIYNPSVSISNFKDLLKYL